jgi:hypothetical protein
MWTSHALSALAWVSVKPPGWRLEIISLPDVIGAAVAGADCTSPLMTIAVEPSASSFTFW